MSWLSSVSVSSSVPCGSIVSQVLHCNYLAVGSLLFSLFFFPCISYDMLSIRSISSTSLDRLVFPYRQRRPATRFRLQQMRESCSYSTRDIMHVFFHRHVSGACLVNLSKHSFSLPPLTSDSYCTADSSMFISSH